MQYIYFQKIIYNQVHFDLSTFKISLIINPLDHTVLAEYRDLISKEKTNSIIIHEQINKYLEITSTCIIRKYTLVSIIFIT